MRPFSADVPPPHAPAGPALARILGTLVGSALLFPGAVAARGDEPPAAIAAWIAQLGSDQFAQREAASRQLAAAGPEALQALAAAAAADDLEVASRAIDLLGGFLDPDRTNGEEGDGPDASLQAERALETLAEGPPGPVAQLAATSLEFHQMGMHEAAQERLEALGARIGDGLVAGGPRGLGVTIDSGWQGEPADFRLLPRLRNLRRVNLHGVKIDASVLAILGRLRGLDTIQLYGTGIGDDGVAALAARFPNAEIDVRKGGKLGVGGQRLIGPCQITQVVAGSAADKAGIQIGDVVLSMDGVPIKNFDGLTDYVGGRAPGDRIEVEVERAIAGKVPQRFNCTVTLDGWD